MSYIYGLTIGPLVKTLETARTTREIAVTSLFFSKLTEAVVNIVEAGYTLLLPAKTEITANYGFYAERVYWLSDEELDEEKLRGIQCAAYKELEGVLPKNNDIELASIIQMYIAHSTCLNGNASASVKPLKIINNKLDLFELQAKLPVKSLRNLIDWLIGKGMATGRDRFVYRFRLDDAAPYFRNYAQEKRYPMALEIAAAPIFYSDRGQYDDKLFRPLDANSKIDIEDRFFDDNNQIEFLKILRQIAKLKNIKFLQQHKYFCVVYADGDGIGKYLNNDLQSTPADLQPASRKLFDFAKKAATTIEVYGGVPVFLGGDDLLFFAPVCNVDSSKSTILGLTQTLNKQFVDLMDSPELTLSFGIAIGYYKYPMDKLLKAAKTNLFVNAKHNAKKNTISLSLTKHSGANFNFLLNMQDREFELVLMLVEQLNANEDEFLKSIAFKLKAQHEIILLICKNVRRIELFFENNFTKDVHIAHEDTFKILAKLIYIIYFTNNYKLPQERLFNLLKYFYFLTENEQHEQI